MLSLKSSFELKSIYTVNYIRKKTIDYFGNINFEDNHTFSY